MESHSTSAVRVHHAAPTSIFAYWPIAAIYALSAWAAFVTFKTHTYPDYMAHLMGYVMVLFGLIKLTDIAGFAHGFGQYDPIAKKSLVYAQTYPFLEILLGVLFILQLLVLPATIVTLIVYGASMYGALRSISGNEELHCVCLGTYFKLPLSTVTIIEAGFMILMCLWMLLAFSGFAIMAM